MNVLRLDDHMELNLYFPVLADREDDPAWFPVVVKGFCVGWRGESVLVEAVKRSDDPLVDNEWRVPFSWLRRPRAVS